METKQVTVKELNELFHSGKYNIEIDSPDGFVPLSKWFDKGVLPMVRLRTANGETTNCAANHLVQRVDLTWVPAGAVIEGDILLTKQGDAKVVSTEEIEPAACYDFTVDHPNHRYWGDGFSSHNSGKSYICSGNIVRDAQAQGIFVVLIDSENALDEAWLHALGVDTDPEKLLKLNMAMIDDVAKTISEFMKEYREMASEDRMKVLFVVDSLGMLLTPTDVNQFQAGELKGDMGRKPKALTALVRNCVNMFGSFNVGLVATNHTYASQDMFDPDDKISGGCLTAGHKVCMADGTTKNIESVEVGDVIVTLGGDVEVSETFNFSDKEVFKLELSDGTVLEATSNHKFLTHRGGDTPYIWKTVTDLEEGDDILTVSEHQ